LECGKPASCGNVATKEYSLSPGCWGTYNIVVSVNDTTCDKNNSPRTGPEEPKPINVMIGCKIDISGRRSIDAAKIRSSKRWGWLSMNSPEDHD